MVGAVQFSRGLEIAVFFMLTRASRGWYEWYSIWQRVAQVTSHVIMEKNSFICRNAWLNVSSCLCSSDENGKDAGEVHAMAYAIMPLAGPLSPGRVPCLHVMAVLTLFLKHPITVDITE